MLARRRRSVRAIVRGDVAIIRRRRRATASRCCGARRHGGRRSGRRRATRFGTSPACRISLDNIVVRPSMTVSDRAMAADQARAGRRLARHRLLSAVTGKGIGVAVIDSGIATSHSALSGKVGVGEFRDRRQSTYDRLRPRHAHRRHHCRVDGWRHDLALQGRRRARARTWSTSRCSTATASATPATSSRASSGRSRIASSIRSRSSTSRSAIPPGGAVRDRSAVPRRREGGAAGLVVVASAGNNGKTPKGAEVLAAIDTRRRAGRYSRRAQHVGHGDARRRHGRDLQLARSDALRAGTEADVVAPGNKIVSLEAAGSYLARSIPISTSPAAAQRLHEDERHQHGGGDGQRRRGVAARVTAR